MVVECIAILIVLLAIVVVFLRSRKQSYALATLPLFFVPAAFLVATAVLLIWQHGAADTALFDWGRTIAVLIGLICSSIMLGFLSGKMKSTRRKLTYQILCGAFLLALTFLLVYHALTADFVLFPL